jgi:hypothetical protein
MKILLFPYYFTKLNFKYHSPRLVQYLLCNNIDVCFEHWGGTVMTLPNSERCLVKFSKTIIKDWPKLVQYCYQIGHLPFYEDHLIDTDGQRQNDLISVVQKLIINTKS